MTRVSKKKKRTPLVARRDHFSDHARPHLQTFRTPNSRDLGENHAKREPCPEQIWDLYHKNTFKRNVASCFLKFCALAWTGENTNTCFVSHPTWPGLINLEKQPTWPGLIHLEKDQRASERNVKQHPGGKKTAPGRNVKKHRRAKKEQISQSERKRNK